MCCSCKNQVHTNAPTGYHLERNLSQFMSGGWDAHHGIFVTVLLQAGAEYRQNSIHLSRGLLAATNALDVGMVPG